MKKKTTLTMVLCCTLMGMLSSCTDDDWNNLRNLIEPPNGETGLTEANFIGKWRCDNVSWPEYNHYEGSATITFGENHEFSIYKYACGKSYGSSGTWTYDNRTHKIVTTATWPERIILATNSSSGLPTLWWDSEYGGKPIIFEDVFMSDSTTLVLKNAIFIKQ